MFCFRRLFLAFLLLQGSSCVVGNPIERVSSGHGLFELTVEEERELGEEILKQILEQVPLVEDPEIVGYVRSIGAEIRRSAGTRPFDYRFFVLRDKAINAFALPAGTIVVHTGLIAAAESEAELASVLAHEVAHVRGRHIAMNVEKAQKVQLAQLAGMVAGAVIGATGSGDAREAGAALLWGSQAAGTSLLLQHTRTMEDEADRVGLRILSRAGYDPAAMKTFFGRLLALKRTSASPPSYFLTHPEVEDRINTVETSLRHLPPAQSFPFPAGDIRRIRPRAIFLQSSPERAAQIFSRGLEESGGTSTEHRLGMALAMRALGRLDEARQHYEVVVADWPTYGRAWAELGEVRQAQGDLDAGLADLEHARELRPQSAVIAEGLARALRAAGRRDEAAAILRELIERNGDDADLYQQLGIVLGEQGEVGPAALELARAALLRRDRRLARYHLARASEALGAEDERVVELTAELAAASKAKSTEREGS